jgi:hypothetical protein
MAESNYLIPGETTRTIKFIGDKPERYVSVWYQTGGWLNFNWVEVRIQESKVDSKVAEINKMGYATKVQSYKPTEYFKFL